MATTWFMDYDGGTDVVASVGNGDSFATRRKRVNNFSAAPVAAGDTIRVMGSPAATSLGMTATWTTGAFMAQQTPTVITNATPIVVTINAHGYSNGDTVIHQNVTVNTNANGTWTVANATANTYELSGSVGNGVTGTFGQARRINTARVVLNAAVTANIDSGEAIWTASANVTPTVLTTDFKEGRSAAQLAVAAAFTTGLAAYFPLGAPTDFSAFKQVSFWIKQTSGTLVAASDLSLKLCTDAVGAVGANTLNVPAIGVLNQWVAFTVDTAAALSAACQSVALYVNVDGGAQTFLLDGIVACKDSTAANSLSLTSLLGKNTAGETWWGIQSINGTRVMLDGHTNMLPSASFRGYSGTTETVTTHKRETIKTTHTTASVQQVSKAGTSGVPIAFEGGWDRAAMTTQNLETWFDGGCGSGNGIDLGVSSFNSMNLINFVRYTTGHVSTALTEWALSNISGNNNTTSGLSHTTGSHFTSTGTLFAVGNGATGMTFTQNGSNLGALVALSNLGVGCTAPGVGSDCLSVIANNNGSNGLSGSISSTFVAITASLNGATEVVTASRMIIDSFTSVGSATTAGTALQVQANDGIIIYGGSSSGHTTQVFSNATGYLHVRNFVFTDATFVGTFTSFANGRVHSENHNGVVGDHRIFVDGGLISSNTTNRHTASGICWAFAPTSAVRDAESPVWVVMARIQCLANVAVTVSAFMQRSSTAMTLNLVAKDAQLLGIATDIRTAASGGAGVYQQESLSFTPTEKGVVEIRVEAYGGTTNTGYVDDMTFTSVADTKTLDWAHIGQPFVNGDNVSAGGATTSRPRGRIIVKGESPRMLTG